MSGVIRSVLVICVLALFAGCPGTTPAPKQPRSRPRARALSTGEVQRLVLQSKKGTVDERKAAVVLLAGQSADAALVAVVKALRDKEPAVRQAAASGLLSAPLDALRSAVPKIMPGLVDALSNGKKTTVIAAQAVVMRIGAPTVAPLVQELREAARNNVLDTEEAAGMAKALAMVGKPALPVLIDLLKKGGKNVDSPDRAVAEEALKLMGPVAAWALVPVVDVPTSRKAAMELLKELGKSAVPALLMLLKHRSYLVRESALSLLSARVTKRTVPVLIGLLTDPHPQVRFMAANVLGSLRDVRALKPLLVALHRFYRPVASAKNPHYANYVALSAVGDALVRYAARAVQGLITALGGPAFGGRAVAAEALGKIGDPKAIPTLMESLSDRSDFVVMYVCKALVQLKASQAVPKMLKLIDRKKPHHTAAYLEALVGLRAKGVQARLRQALKWRGKSDLPVLLAAIAGLATLNSRGTTGHLSKLLRGRPEPKVVLAVLRGLGRIGDKAAKRVLKRYARSKDKAIAAAAQDALRPKRSAKELTPPKPADYGLDDGKPQMIIQPMRITGGLTSAHVRGRLTRIRAKLLGCYGKAVKRYPKLKGRLVFKIAVNRRGQVTLLTLATDTVKNAAVSLCMKRHLKRIRFGRPRGAMAVVTLPIRLTTRY